ncbi:hypothetical protein MBLNU457_g0966t1 [Dothideomycetes sp. NU457]
MLSLSLLSLAASALALSTTTADVCDLAPYNRYSTLSTNAAVADYCSSVLATYKPTSTLIVVSTSVVPVAAEDNEPITSLSIIQSTATVSQGAQSTGFTDIWVTKTTHKTITIYTSTSTSTNPTAASASACNLSSASSLLASLAPAQLPTLCSCLGALPSPSTLSTMTYITQTHISTITQTTGVATTFATGFVVLTAEGATTQSFTFTTTVAQTKTVYAAAPSYTKVFGPKAGCADVVAVGAKQLNETVSEQSVAVKQCQEFCTSQANCSSVFVQHMDTDYAPLVPFWKCFTNNETFDAATDVQCGRTTGIWGNAVAFNALDRGQ